ncbi:MAG: 54S ribosomal protein L17 mitochondrial [Vezdaea aestivalis]|nr:MAG: 54S ribosomal protein L17 mitochondrial [Vezdaea aestivalis]
MKPRGRSTRQLAQLIRTNPPILARSPSNPVLPGPVPSSIPKSYPPTITSSLSSQIHSPYSTATPNQPSSAAPPLSPPSKAPSPPLPASQTYRLSASALILRSPQLTRTPSSFESAFYQYQRRLNERLVLPFTKNFYFAPDTPAANLWNKQIKARKTAARDIGGYFAHSEENWNDEAKVGEMKVGEEGMVEIRDAVLGDVAAPRPGADGIVNTEQAVQAPRGRETEADRKGDKRSLDRKLERTLVLVVKTETAKVDEEKEVRGRWMLPAARVLAQESLTEAVERVIESTAGANLLTWLVGHNPVGYFCYEFKGKNSELEQAGDKTFFLKARALAGQVNLTGNSLGLADFAWLTKEEVQAAVSPQYWAGIKHMIPGQ